MRYDLEMSPRKIADCWEINNVARNIPKRTPMNEALFPMSILRATFNIISKMIGNTCLPNFALYQRFLCLPTRYFKKNNWFLSFFLWSVSRAVLNNVEKRLPMN